MRTLALSALLVVASLGEALAWDQEGHSIIAEIAQRRLSPDASVAVAQVLGAGHSLASIASWADDAREERPETYNWHFVDIPVDRGDYQPSIDCRDSDKGDCIVAELDRLKDDVRCASGDKKSEALRFAVHFVGDIHQPLHTVLEEKGGNLIQVDLFTHGLICTGTCRPLHDHTNFHAAWDTGIIEKTVWNWGADVDRLETGWLQSAEANAPGIDGGEPADWAVETHNFAQMIWNLLPGDDVLDDNYFQQVLPVLDRQLVVAGLRLARFLNEAYGYNQCPAR
jgi:hypothetical protein